MNGLRIILAGPDPLGLPAPVWLLKFLLIFTFVLHLLFMNAALGGSLVWVWANWRVGRSRRSDVAAIPVGLPAFRPGAVPQELDAPDYDVLARALGRMLPVATAFTITTGVAPLLFVQLLYGQLFYTSSVLMAWLWFAIVPLLLAGYCANYAVASARPATVRALSLGVLSAVLLAAIGLIFTNNMTLMLRPEQHAPLYLASDAGLHTNLGDTWVWPRFAHMLVASLAVTGLLVAWVGRLQRARDRHVAARIERRGTRLFMAATLIECAVGAVFFVALPTQVREVFATGVTPDPILVVAGVVFALAGVVIVRRSLVVGSCAAIVALADMAVVRHRVRQLMLEPYFQPESLPVAARTTAFVLFALLFVAGLGIVGWMVWKFVIAGHAEPAKDAVPV